MVRNASCGSVQTQLVISRSVSSGTQSKDVREEAIVLWVGVHLWSLPGARLNLEQCLLLQRTDVQRQEQSERLEPSRSLA